MSVSERPAGSQLEDAMITHPARNQSDPDNSCWLVKSQLIDYFGGHIVFWEREHSMPLQFYEN